VNLLGGRFSDSNRIETDDRQRHGEDEVALLTSMFLERRQGRNAAGITSQRPSSATKRDPAGLGRRQAPREAVISDHIATNSGPPTAAARIQRLGNVECPIMQGLLKAPIRD